MEPPLKSKSTFSHQAARLSWICPLIAFLVVIVGKQIASQVAMDLIVLCFTLTGLIFGLIALLGIPRHGWKGIIGPAMAGLVINGLLLFIFVTNFLAARAKLQRRADHVSPPIVIVGTPLRFSELLNNHNRIFAAVKKPGFASAF